MLLVPTRQHVECIDIVLDFVGVIVYNGSCAIVALVDILEKIFDGRDRRTNLCKQSGDQINDKLTSACDAYRLTSTLICALYFNVTYKLCGTIQQLSICRPLASVK